MMNVASMDLASMDLASMDLASMDDASISRFLRSHLWGPIPGSISGPNPVAVAMKPVFSRMLEKYLSRTDSQGNPDPANLAAIPVMQALQEAFLSREGRCKPSMLDLDQLHRRLTTYPAHLPDSDYLKDLDQKIVLVQQINQLCRNFHTDVSMKELHLDKASFWSTLMTMDLERLKEVRCDLDDMTSAKAKRLLLTDFPVWAMATPMLLRSFIRGYAKEPSRKYSPAKPLRNTSEIKHVSLRCPSTGIGESREAELTTFTHKVLRHNSNRCIITKLRADVYNVIHIIPPDLLRSRAQLIKSLKGMRSWYTDERIDALLKKLTSESCHENIINTRRNMICMHLQMGTLWYMGEFMLKPMGRPVQVVIPVPAEDPTEEPQMKTVWVLTLIFHWLRKTEFPDMQQTIPFDTDPRQHFEDLDPHDLGAVDYSTAHSMVGGDIVRIFAYDEKDLPDCDLLDLRANLYTAFSLAAAVDPRAYKFEGDGDDEGYNPEDDFDQEIATTARMRMQMKRDESSSNPRRRNTPSAAADIPSHVHQDSKQVEDAAVSLNEDAREDTAKSDKMVDEIQSSTAEKEEQAESSPRKPSIIDTLNKIRHRMGDVLRTFQKVLLRRREERADKSGSK
ncbi:hypothetical protein CPAR01_02349 [Colletotrichum paranaense]|uniref:HNH nuclease domain-containing protein n=1 Tax=Colletotrichum paranaense TaxID=1914294 RepID=A0ABQ9SZ92_9PEZI|nr:uncharacterized protein CPAR01_02349 [Colletotrichum paranaense]KAK1544847.1 hypothetical protein CPAR01_02349 [Colletotrichum paranaense]